MQNTYPQENPFLDKPLPPKTNKGIAVLQAIALFTIILLVGWIVILDQNQVKGPSMQPNFYTDEFLLTSTIPNLITDPNLARALNADYQRGDVVVLQKPGFDDFVKRVIGLPGETIQIRDGYVYIDNQRLVEEYLAPDLYTNGGSFIREGGQPILIPEGHYVLIGDNRPQSNDSRYVEIGFIKREWIKGKVLVRIWPFETFSFIPQGKYRLE